MLFSSHQLDLVEDICEAVAIIHHGRLVVSGPVEELRRGDRPRLAVRVGGDADGAWARSLAADLGEVEAVRPEGTALISLTTGADSQRILDLARAAGPIEHFSFEDRPALRGVPRGDRGFGRAGRGRARRRGGQPVNRQARMTWLVARRELRQRAKTRAFAISTVVLVIAVALGRGAARDPVAEDQAGPDRRRRRHRRTISGIITEAGRLAGGQAVAVPQPSLAAAEAALRSGDLSAVLVPDSEIIVKQVPLGGVSGAVGDARRSSPGCPS